MTVEFTVMGVPCLGLNGGPAFKHNEAFSDGTGEAGVIGYGIQGPWRSQPEKRVFRGAIARQPQMRIAIG